MGRRFPLGAAKSGSAGLAGHATHLAYRVQVEGHGEGAGVEEQQVGAEGQIEPAIGKVPAGSAAVR